MKASIGTVQVQNSSASILQKSSENGEKMYPGGRILYRCQANLFVTFCRKGTILSKI